MNKLTLKINNISFAFILFFFFACKSKQAETPTPASSTDTQPDLAALSKTLNNYIFPLNKPIIQLTNQDLAKFDELKSIKIIGLGEATHGSKEFIQMKQRLFKYFVEHFNHKVFAFEMDFSEAMIFDHYIQTGEGDLTQLMKYKMLYFTWATTEVRDLFEWMKNYNIGKDPADKLHLYGIDCVTFRYNTPELIARVSKLDNNLAAEIDKTMTPLLQKDTSVTLEMVNTILDKIRARKATFIAQSSVEEYDIIEHIAQIMVQTVNYLQNQKGMARDISMGENVFWLSQRTNYPISVCAHNLHIFQPSDVIDGKRNMGYRINNLAQGNYKSVGFSFSTGAATALNVQDKNNLVYNSFPTTLTGFINQLFGMNANPNYFFRTSEVLANSQLRTYFDITPFYQIGAYFDNTQFSPIIKNYPSLTTNTYDYMIHFNNITHNDNFFVEPNLK